METEIKYLDAVKERILNPRKSELVEVLRNFIDDSSKSLIKESGTNLYEIKVVNFEFDEPFSFSYAAYPGSNLIPNEFRNTVVDNLEIKTAWDELYQIFRELGFNDNDYGEWYNEKTSEFINEAELCKNMECLWFYECWQIAKNKSSSPFNARCFLIEHDVFDGIDLDSGNFLTDKEIQRTLIEEGLYIEPNYESKYIVHKNDTIQIWGTPMETFLDYQLALDYLKIVVSRNNEDAKKNYLIRKWLKMPYVEPGQDPWVIDTDFGKKFID